MIDRRRFPRRQACDYCDYRRQSLKLVGMAMFSTRVYSSICLFVSGINKKVVGEF